MTETEAGKAPQATTPDGGQEAPRQAGPDAPGAVPRPTPRVDPKLLEILVCPVTRQPLTYDAAAQELVSPAAGLAYPIRDGIPIMLQDEARPLAADG